MTVSLSNNGLIKIDSSPLERMEAYQQIDRNSSEGGGVLLGRFILNSKNIVVDKVTVPMIGDKRTRSGFIRGEKMHQRIIESSWRKSEGRCNYLGEWHTHPEMYPTPSGQDIKNWKEILSSRIFSSLYLYFVIVGTRETRIWEGNSRTKKIKRLR